MNKQELAKKIWEAANQMRSKIEASEYKDYILGFIFYKYLSDQEVRFLRKNGATQEEIERLDESDSGTVEYIQDNIGYFIAYNHLYSTWLDMGRDFDIHHVHEALSAFSRNISVTHKRVFDGIFETLETGLSKLGETSGSRTKAISDLIQLIKDIPTNGQQDYDVLGFIYEYLISMFAQNAGKKAGEFYTPQQVSTIMSEIVAEHLKDRREIQIYDPTSGSGSLLINIGKSAEKHIGGTNKIKYYAQELKRNTYNLTRMNLVMRGILPSNIITRNGDTLEEDWPFFHENDPTGTYEPLYVDAVVSNPPYSQRWDPEDKETDPRYARFGLAPKSKADYAFLLHDLYHIKPDGIMTIVLPHGVLFRGGQEGEIRKNLIEYNHIDAIIGLPANIFYGTGIPTIIMVLKQQRSNTDVLIIDASKGFVKEGKNNVLRESDIKRTVDTVALRSESPKYSRRVSLDEIRENDYNLNIPRYVDSSEKPESWDIYASMFGGIPKQELDDLAPYWEAFPGLRETLFQETSADHVEVADEDIKAIIRNHESVNAFRERFADAFSGYSESLRDRLLIGITNVDITKEQDVLSAEIFERLAPVPLVDQYQAYQLLSDQWEDIQIDLEMIQTEGFETAKRVDPNMVMKKRRGQDVEVQEGYLGRVIPFELIQDTLLKDESNALKQKDERLAQVISEQQEILDSLSEDDKEDLSEIMNDDNTAFIAASLNRSVKELLSDPPAEPYEEESPEAKQIRMKDLLDEERELKREIKSETESLHILTKETIEGLDDNQIHDLLELKWITPLIDGIKQMPISILEELLSKVEALTEKYSTTLSDIDKEIHETEQELIAMIDQLSGSETDLEGLAEFKRLLGGA